LRVRFWLPGAPGLQVLADHATCPRVSVVELRRVSNAWPTNAAGSAVTEAALSIWRGSHASTAINR